MILLQLCYLQKKISHQPPATAGFGDEVAIIWEGNDPKQSRKFTYLDLLKEVSLFANALKSLGVQKGDRVCLYMQMIPELAIAVLACARIGAVMEHVEEAGIHSGDSACVIPPPNLKEQIVELIESHTRKIFLNVVTKIGRAHV